MNRQSRETLIGVAAVFLACVLAVAAGYFFHQAQYLLSSLWEKLFSK